jgi:hypothetical protein
VKKILIVGTARNVDKKITHEISNISSLLANDFILDFFIVESDSVDNTLGKLESIRKSFTNFEYETMGMLESEIPSRIERLRHCRNRYVDYIRRHEFGHWDYIIVMDLDGINDKLSKRGLMSCFDNEKEWDACFPIQKHGYHDLLALRATDWNTSNPFQVVRELISEETKKAEHSLFKRKLILPFRIDRIRRHYFYAKMLRLGKANRLIPVQSAFGGIAIYKSKVFFQTDYGTADSIEGCEHVDFNVNVAKKEFKLMINTSFVNSNWNSYNLNRYFLVRLYRKTGLRVKNF